MTGHDVTLSRWEATAVADAVVGVLKAVLNPPPPPRTTCRDCRALHPAGEPCDICELRNQRRMTTAEAIAEIEFLTDQGCDLDYIARALQMRPDTITRLLTRHGRRDLLQRHTRRNAA